MPGISTSMVGTPLFDFWRRPTRPPPGSSTMFPGYAGTTTGFPPTVKSSKKSSADFCPPGTSRIDTLLPFVPRGFPLGIRRSFGDGGVDDDTIRPHEDRSTYCSGYQGVRTVRSTT